VTKQRFSESAARLRILEHPAGARSPLRSRCCCRGTVDDTHAAPPICPDLVAPERLDGRSVDRHHRFMRWRMVEARSDRRGSSPGPLSMGNSSERAHASSQSKLGQFRRGRRPSGEEVGCTHPRFLDAHSRTSKAAARSLIACAYPAIQCKWVGRIQLDRLPQGAIPASASPWKNNAAQNHVGWATRRIH
jgi:hypothetical protein